VSWPPAAAAAVRLRLEHTPARGGGCRLVAAAAASPRLARGPQCALLPPTRTSLASHTPRTPLRRRRRRSPASPLTSASLERALTEVAAALDPELPWEGRMAALARLDGLTARCAGRVAHFPELLSSTGVLAALGAQTADLRSTVVKAACATIAALCRALGGRGEGPAVALLPHLLRRVATTIAVMSESAAACCAALVSCVPTPAVLGAVAGAITDARTKSGKIKGAAAGLLGQALREWSPSTLAGCTGALEAGITAAAQDASADARQAAKGAFGAYAGRLPGPAAAFLAGLPPALQARVQEQRSSVPPAAAAAMPASRKPWLRVVPAAAAGSPQALGGLARKSAGAAAGSPAGKGPYSPLRAAWAAADENAAPGGSGSGKPRSLSRGGSSGSGRIAAANLSNAL